MKYGPQGHVDVSFRVACCSAIILPWSVRSLHTLHCRALRGWNHPAGGSCRGAPVLVLAAKPWLIVYASSWISEVAVLVSSDADMIPCVERVQEKGFKVINTVWPGRGHQLAQVCSSSLSILDAASQLIR